ncbi:MAG: hypothetical protein LBC64_06865 [Fibromonadaceae bacterium]|jgi:hypothetical protein|nr:hypothetical protein [Fibromonadaceae bacterium]
MKFIKAVAFCLVFFFETVFSQDSTSVSLDPLPQDSAYVQLPQDSLPQDSLLQDSLPKDTTLVPNDTTGADTVIIKRGLRFFASAGVQLIDFKERLNFQNLLEVQLNKYIDDYVEDSTGYTIPEKQDFQTVNLAFPITAGIMWQFNNIHSIGLGAGFLYDKESVIIKDKYSNFRNFSYTLKAFPLFVEYRLGISEKLISIREVDYFSVLLRYYWMLPGTEISSSWDSVRADFEPLGNGFGVFLTYCFSKWERVEIWGEMGYLNIDVKSSDEKSTLDSWNLGGISVMVRAVF